MTIILTMDNQGWFQLF